MPFTPGGSTDITARLVGNRLQEVWGQSVVVENKPGAGGNIAADMVAHSDADGYTIFIVGPGMATNQFLYPSLSYDPVGDFDPVTLLITQPNLMCVPNSSPAKSVQEFIAFCNDNKRQGHLRLVRQRHHAASERRTVQAAGQGRDDPHPLSRRRAGDQRSRSPAASTSSSTTCPRSCRMSAGRHPARARGDDQRARRHHCPRSPTIAEIGVPGFDVFSWFGFFVPVKTPPDVIAKINADTNAALVHPPVKSRFEELGAVPKGSTPAELAAFLKSEIDKWGPVIRDARIKVEN